MPSEHPAQGRQRVLGHGRTVLILDAVEQGDDLDPADVLDRPGAQLGQYQPFQDRLALIDCAQPRLAFEIDLGDRPESIGPAGGFPDLGVDPVGDMREPFPALGARGFERHCAVDAEGARGRIAIAGVANDQHEALLPVSVTRTPRPGTCAVPPEHPLACRCGLQCPNGAVGEGFFSFHRCVDGPGTTLGQQSACAWLTRRATGCNDMC